MYGAFLQEAAQILGEPALHKKSQEITKIGDKWRTFAYDCGRMCKGRADDLTYADLSDQLKEIGEDELRFFKSLYNIKLKA